MACQAHIINILFVKSMHSMSNKPTYLVLKWIPKKDCSQIKIVIDLQLYLTSLDNFTLLKDFWCFETLTLPMIQFVTTHVLS